MQTNREMFNAAIYKALGDGLAKLIKNGLAFTVLIGAIGGLLFAVYFLIKQSDADRKEWRAEKQEIQKECSEEINRLRLEVYECNERYTAILARLAQMDRRINFKN